MGVLRSHGKHNCLSRSRPQGSGITPGSAQWTTLPSAQLKAESDPCMMGGTELMQQCRGCHLPDRDRGVGMIMFAVQGLGVSRRKGLSSATTQWPQEP